MQHIRDSAALHAGLIYFVQVLLLLLLLLLLLAT
jgi:hypothetical protein